MHDVAREGLGPLLLHRSSVLHLAWHLRFPVARHGRGVGRGVVVCHPFPFRKRGLLGSDETQAGNLGPPHTELTHHSSHLRMCNHSGSGTCSRDTRLGLSSPPGLVGSPCLAGRHPWYVGGGRGGCMVSRRVCGWVRSADGDLTDPLFTYRVSRRRARV